MRIFDVYQDRPSRSPPARAGPSPSASNRRVTRQSASLLRPAPVRCSRLSRLIVHAWWVGCRTRRIDHRQPSPACPQAGVDRPPSTESSLSTSGGGSTTVDIEAQTVVDAPTRHADEMSV